jgi:hypothetical protein
MRRDQALRSRPKRAVSVRSGAELAELGDGDAQSVQGRACEVT